jgi:hypothetical protein
MNEKLFLDTAEMAVLARMSVRTWHRKKSAGEWPMTECVRLGRKLLYPVELLEEMKKRAGTQSSGINTEVER